MHIKTRYSNKTVISIVSVCMIECLVNQWLDNGDYRLVKVTVNFP